MVIKKGGCGFMSEPEVSIKNTKAEIMDALNAALQREKEAKTQKSDPVAEEAVKKEIRIVESTKKAVEENVFSEALTKKFNELEAAISIEEKRLSELYGIEKELQNLTLVINAGKDVLEKIESNKKEQTAALENEIRELKDNYAQKNEELKADYDSRAKALKTERDRETEEYTYQLKRFRTLENNEWEDKKISREAALAEKEKAAAQIMAEAQEKADNIKSLEEKVADIPAMIEREVATAVNDTTNNLNRDFDHKIEIAGKDYSNTISQLEYKVESLTQELSKATALSSSLQSKLDKAYAEMRDLATKTVETSGGVRFISNPSAEKQQ